MCVCVFTDGERGRYEALKPQARALGAAFQKVNFLRDIRSDAEDRGRVYFPQVDLSEFTQKAKSAIETDIAADFAYALPGIKALPAGCGVGVYLAYVYYSRLFQKIQNTPPAVLLQQRVRISNAEKLWLWALSRIHFRLGWL
jgi:phytoene/squalene synthetase